VFWRTFAPTTPTKAMGESEPTKVQCSTVRSRASACGGGPSGGRKYSSPVLPPRLTARAGLLEAAAADHDLGAAALRLHAAARSPFTLAERAALDPAAMAADQIDARTAGAPAFERALRDREVVDSGELDAVPVAALADVGHPQAAEREVVRRGRPIAAVVDVQAVAGRGGAARSAPRMTIGRSAVPASPSSVRPPR